VRAARALAAALALAAAPAPPASADLFLLPTANRALLDGGGPEKFFAPVPGRDWNSGRFGCVRSEGTRMHEGLDILSLERDRAGEPTDPVLAVAEGTVAYANRRAGLSNYGLYLVLRHRLEDLEIFTLYAHLREIPAALQPGTAVRRGQRVGTLGRTTNTRTPIGKDRAHLHFEVNLLLNDAFEAWHREHLPGQRNDHGSWHGRNLLGVDPEAVYRAQAAAARFSLAGHLRGRTEMCRVLVPAGKFPFLRRYAPLVKRGARAEREGIAAFEVSLDYNGVPFAWQPRARSELSAAPAVRLLAVDEAEFRRHTCRRLVVKRGQVWTLTAAGQELIGLLTYTP
jgi:murein DD-endopeptidase MepM/ murein hydrolase activator NlpD